MMIRGIVTRSFLRCVNKGWKVCSIELYEVAIAYIIFFLQGDTDIKIGLYIPKIPAIFCWRVLVAVAVSAITGTPSGSRLRISPRRNSAPRNVSPLS